MSFVCLQLLIDLQNWSLRLSENGACKTLVAYIFVLLWESFHLAFLCSNSFIFFKILYPSTWLFTELFKNERRRRSWFSIWICSSCLIRNVEFISLKTDYFPNMFCSTILLDDCSHPNFLIFFFLFLLDSYVLYFYFLDWFQLCINIPLFNGRYW